MTSDRDRFRPYKFRFELRFTVFEQHRDHFSQIAAQFFQSGALRMSSGKSGHITNKQFCLWIALDYRGECSHDEIVRRPSSTANRSENLFEAVANIFCELVPFFRPQFWLLRLAAIAPQLN
jgi:hypothetical protein